jgi:CubicO group peptidase (beta-lactamase class C family)
MQKLNLTTKIVLLFLFLFLNFSCTKENSSNPVEPVDNTKLEAAFSQAAQMPNLKSLVVSRNGTIVKEAYFNGGGANITHDVRSVTKSVIAILTGIAIEKGLITSTEQPIDSFIRPLVPDLTTEKGNIRIGHLLTMSSGFEWDELNSNFGYNNWITAENQVQYLFAKPLSSTPGQTFTYNSAAIHILSVIISRKSNMQTLDFANIHFFERLEMGERNWQVDRQGYNNGGAGLELTPREMIKIGNLILDGGEYLGRRIVSSEWIDKMTTQQISINASTMNYATGYGYGWWTGNGPKGNYFFANGYGGQFIVVVPNLKLVVVATNKWSGVSSSTTDQQWITTINLIMSDILSAFN